MDKSKKIIIFLFVITISMIFKPSSVFADIKDYNGSGGSGSASGTGKYHNFNGFRIGVFAATSTGWERVSGLKIVDIVNRPGSLSDEKSLSNTYYVKSCQKTKNLYLTKTETQLGCDFNNIKVAIEKKYGKYQTPAGNDVYFIDEIVGADVFYNYAEKLKIPHGTIASYFSSNNYKNLLKMLEKTGYNCSGTENNSYCSQDLYVVVEPMFEWNGILYTGYEISKSLGSKITAGSLYTNIASLYVSSNYISNDILGIEPQTSTSSDKDVIVSKLKTKAGMGIGIYKISDIVGSKCSQKKEISCLTASIGTTGSDSSCYTEAVTDAGGTTLKCQTTFELTNNLGLSSFATKAGQPKINLSIIDPTNSKDGIVAVGTLTRKCYGGNIAVLNPTYTDYITDIKLDGISLTTVETGDSLKLVRQSASNGISEYKTTIHYRMSPIYANNLTGKETNNSSDRLIGYGTLSKLNEFVTDKKMNFTVETKHNGGTTLESSCTYSTTKGIVNKENSKKLDLEFRIVDTENAFPGTLGSGRTTGNNWCNKTIEANLTDFDNDGIISSLDYLKLKEKIDKKAPINGGDINGDGQIDQSDLNIYLNYLNASTTGDCSNNNAYATSIMNNTNNSLNKNKETAKYHIELTPSTIKEIREYNQYHAYDEDDIECDSKGNNCSSTFLNDYNFK